MSYEYVKLTDSEVNYTRKHLLNIELESLTSIKKLQDYKNFRNKELNLKISLKSSSGQIKGFLELLNGTLKPPLEFTLYSPLKQDLFR